MPAAVTLSEVRFAYAGAGATAKREIVKGVSLACPAGKVTAIMGGSGCGKTTLLRLMGGMIKPSEGQVSVLSENPAMLDEDALRALRQRMGFLFQFGALFTDLSVFDNVAFPLREHSGKTEAEIAEIVLAKLHAVGLRAAAPLMPSQISGGMARRVAFARAVALGPELMLYDEPFAGLDPISLGVTARLIRSLNAEFGATSIIVSHDVAETFAIADHVIMMSAGKVLVAGSPAEISASDNAEVQQFITGSVDGPISFHMPESQVQGLPKPRAGLHASAKQVALSPSIHPEEVTKS